MGSSSRSVVLTVALGMSCLLWGGCKAKTPCSTIADCPAGYECAAHECVQLCNADVDCAAATQICVDGRCESVANPNCHEDGDCANPGECEILESARCYGAKCHYRPLPVEEERECDPGDLCVSNAKCDGHGACGGVRTVCDQAPVAECSTDDSKLQTYAGIGRCEPTTGACLYRGIEIDCPSCTATCLAACLALSCTDNAGGCQTGGYCTPLPAPAQCTYSAVEDGASCDRPGSAVGTNDGVCSTGRCVACREAADCGAFVADRPECFGVACVTNACEYSPLSDVSCATQTCEDGAQHGARTCGVDGLCADGVTVDCQGRRCAPTGNECLSTCVSTDDCLDGLTCEPDGSCSGDLPDGASCAGKDNDDCTSGHCVDNVCCKTACDGVCMTCAAGTGECDITPADDNACGTIDCDNLDAPCRNYSDLTADRCAALGACKLPNSAACTVYTNLAAGTQATGCRVCRECNNNGGCRDAAAGSQRSGCDAICESCQGGDCQSSTAVTCYRDVDGDGYASPSAAPYTQCSTCASGWTTRAPGTLFDGHTDCEGSRADMHPGAGWGTEAIDYNCTGAIEKNPSSVLVSCSGRCNDGCPCSVENNPDCGGTYTSSWSCGGPYPDDPCEGSDVTVLCR